MERCYMMASQKRMTNLLKILTSSNSTKKK